MLQSDRVKIQYCFLKAIRTLEGPHLRRALTRVPLGPLDFPFSLHSLTSIAAGSSLLGRLSAPDAPSGSSRGQPMLFLVSSSLQPPLPFPLLHHSALPADPARGAPSNPAPRHEPPGVHRHECTQSQLHRGFPFILGPASAPTHTHTWFPRIPRLPRPQRTPGARTRGSSDRPCSVIGGS